MIIKLFPIIALAFLFSGCARTVNTVGNADIVNMPNLISDARVTTDYTLSRKVGIVSVATAPSPSGLLRMQVTVFNKTNKIQSFFYKVDWRDEHGMAISTATSGWREAQIMPGEQKDFTAVAPTAGAKDFSVKFVEQK